MNEEKEKYSNSKVVIQAQVIETAINSSFSNKEYLVLFCADSYHYFIAKTKDPIQAALKLEKISLYKVWILGFCPYRKDFEQYISQKYQIEEITRGWFRLAVKFKFSIIADFKNEGLTCPPFRENELKSTNLINKSILKGPINYFSKTNESVVLVSSEEKLDPLSIDFVYNADNYFLLGTLKNNFFKLVRSGDPVALLKETRENINYSICLLSSCPYDPKFEEMLKEKYNTNNNFNGWFLLSPEDNIKIELDFIFEKIELRKKEALTLASKESVSFAEEVSI